MRGFDKLAVIGSNGTGKTTLIKTLMGVLKPLAGSFRFYKELKFGYFDQNLDHFNPEISLINTVHNLYPQKTLYEVRSDLARVGFTGEDVFKLVKVLSGGELVKLRILLLMLEKPDLLILDEPTNHLDIDSKNIVEDVFEDYQGPIIFISHDRYFINKVATKIVKLDDKAHVFSGNYEEYLKNIQMNEIKVKTKKTNPAANNNDKEIKKLQKDIEELETEIREIQVSLYDSDIYNNHIVYREKEMEINRKEKKLEKLYANLEELGSL
jgi:ATP-binding cassette subfamily F protein 3